MNQKELNEIRRHLSLKRCGIHKIYGCFVSSGKEIISDFQTSFGLMSEFEAEKYLSLLKKTLSGTLGKNLLDLSFPPSRWLTAQSTSACPPCETLS